MKVMFELDNNDIKKLADFVKKSAFNNEKVLDALGKLLEECKSTSKESKEEETQSDSEYVKQIKSAIKKEIFESTGDAADMLKYLNNAIENRGYATVYKFLLKKRGLNFEYEMEASYDALVDYGWTEPLTLADLIVSNIDKEYGYSINPDTITRLDLDNYFH